MMVHNHGTIKMKLVDVNSVTDSDFNVEHNVKDHKFKVDDHVKISK